jgi:HEPN domain-containing protein
MSKENEVKALLFLYDAVTDKMAMDCAYAEKIYSPAVYHAQQTTEKAVKACLAVRGVYLKEHHVTSVFKREVIPNSGSLENEFQALLKEIIRLESLDTEPRYSVTHITQYNDKTVKSFCEISKKVLDLGFKFVELKTGLDQIPRETSTLGELILRNYPSIQKKEV